MADVNNTGPDDVATRLNYDSNGRLIRDNATVLTEMRSNAARVVRAEIDNPMDTSLRDIVEGYTQALNGEVGGEQRPKNAVRTLAGNPELLQQAEALVGSDAKFAFVAGGNDSFVLAFNNDAGEMKILRVTTEKVSPTNAGDMVLKPISETEIGGVRFQTMEPVADYGAFERQGVITRAEAENMMADFDGKLAGQGNVIVDKHFGNYGMTADGKQIAHDLGAVRSIDAAAHGAGTPAKANISDIIADELVEQLPRGTTVAGFNGLEDDVPTRRAAMREMAESIVSRYPDIKPGQIRMMNEPGSSAQVFTLANDENVIIRVSNAAREPGVRPDNSTTLQAIESRSLAGGRLNMEVMPRIETLRDALPESQFAAPHLREQAIRAEVLRAKGLFALEGMNSDDVRDINIGYARNAQGERVMTVFDPGPLNPEDISRFGSTIRIEDLPEAARRYGEQVTKRDWTDLSVEEFKEYAQQDAREFTRTRMGEYVDGLNELPGMGVDGSVSINGKEYSLKDIGASREAIIKNVTDTIDKGDGFAVRLNVDPQTAQRVLQPYQAMAQQQQHTNAGVPPEDAAVARERQIFVQQRTQTLIKAKGLSLESALEQAREELRTGTMEELEAPKAATTTAKPQPRGESNTMIRQQQGVGNLSSPEEAAEIRNQQIKAQQEAAAKAAPAGTAPSADEAAGNTRWQQTTQQQQQSRQRPINDVDARPATTADMQRFSGASEGNPETLKEIDAWMEQAQIEDRMYAEIDELRIEMDGQKKFKEAGALPHPEAERLHAPLEFQRQQKILEAMAEQEATPLTVAPEADAKPKHFAPRNTFGRRQPEGMDQDAALPRQSNQFRKAALNLDVAVDVPSAGLSAEMRAVETAVDDFKMPKRPHVKGGLIGAAAEVGITATIGTIIGVANRSNDEDVISAGANGAGAAVKQMVGYNDFRAGDNVRGAAAVVDTATGSAFAQTVDASRENERRLAVPQDKLNELIGYLKPHANAKTGNQQLDNLGLLLDMKRRGFAEVSVGTDGRLEQPMGTITVDGYLVASDRPIDAKIREEAGIYLGNGGTLEQARMALDPQFKANAAATDLIALAATHGMSGDYPTGNKHLERIRDLKTKNVTATNDPQLASETSEAMMNEARAYLASGKTLKDARFAYYRIATVVEESIGQDLEAMGKTKKFDLNGDGNISINEISRVMGKAGVTSWPDFNKDEMTSAPEVVAAVARAESKGR